MHIVKIPLEMIFYSNDKGELTPLKFRYIDNEQAWCSIKIDRVVKKETEKLAGTRMIKYTCQSQIDDNKKIYELKYEIESCKWMLYRI